MKGAQTQFLFLGSCRGESLSCPQATARARSFLAVPRPDPTGTRPAAFSSSSRWSFFNLALTGDFRLWVLAVFYADECIFQHSVCPLFAIPSSVFHPKTMHALWRVSILSDFQSIGEWKAAFIRSVLVSRSDGWSAVWACCCKSRRHHHGDRPSASRGSWASPFSTIL